MPRDRPAGGCCGDGLLLVLDVGERDAARRRDRAPGRGRTREPARPNGRCNRRRGVLGLGKTRPSVRCRRLAGHDRAQIQGGGCRRFRWLLPGLKTSRRRRAQRHEAWLRGRGCWSERGSAATESGRGRRRRRDYVAPASHSTGRARRVVEQEVLVERKRLVDLAQSGHRGAEPGGRTRPDSGRPLGAAGRRQLRRQRRRELRGGGPRRIRHDERAVPLRRTRRPSDVGVRIVLLMPSDEVLNEYARPGNRLLRALSFPNEGRERRDEVSWQLVEKVDLQDGLHRRCEVVHAGSREVVRFVEGRLGQDRADVAQLNCEERNQVNSRHSRGNREEVSSPKLRSTAEQTCLSLSSKSSFAAARIWTVCWIY